MIAQDLIQCVGQPYKRVDDNGKALGCMAPVYLLYPNAPRFKWPPRYKLGEVMEQKFEKYATKIELKDIQPGDIVLIKLFEGLLHPAVYIGNDRIAHCLDSTGIQLSRLSPVRIKGVYRVCQQVD